jgi:hypothetical protein
VEQERLIGSPNSVTGDRYAYSFTGQYAPRVGVSVDPTGNGNIKVYYNFGRFFEFLPLDAAERSLSQELDFIGARFAPAFTVNGAGQRIVTLGANGAPIPVIDAAHLLSGADASGGLTNGITVSASDLSAITAGTKLGFQDEHIIGADFQLPKNFRSVSSVPVPKPQASVEDMAVSVARSGKRRSLHKPTSSAIRARGLMRPQTSFRLRFPSAAPHRQVATPASKPKLPIQSPALRSETSVSEALALIRSPALQSTSQMALPMASRIRSGSTGRSSLN